MKPVLTLIFQNILILFTTMREEDNEGLRRSKKERGEKIKMRKKRESIRKSI